MEEGTLPHSNRYTWCTHWAVEQHWRLGGAGRVMAGSRASSPCQRGQNGPKWARRGGRQRRVDNAGPGPRCGHQTEPGWAMRELVGLWGAVGRLRVPWSAIYWAAHRPAPCVSRFGSIHGPLHLLCACVWLTASWSPTLHTATDCPFGRPWPSARFCFPIPDRPSSSAVALAASDAACALACAPASTARAGDTWLTPAPSLRDTCHSLTDLMLSHRARALPPSSPSGSHNWPPRAPCCWPGSCWPLMPLSMLASPGWPGPRMARPSRTP